MNAEIITMDPEAETQQTKSQVIEQGEFRFWTTQEFGMTFKASTPEDEWLKAMAALLSVFETVEDTHARIMFRLGDALRFGESQFGERYAQAIDLTRKRLALSAKTIRNVVTICGNVPEMNRQFTLTISHFDAVQSCEIALQAELLRMAESEGQSVAALKTAVARKRLTKAEIALIATVTDKDPLTELSHGEIKKFLKRARDLADGKPPTNKAVIDLESESGLQHAAEKIAEFFEKYDADPGNEAPKHWSDARKKAWGSLTAIAKFARRAGLSR